MKICEQHLKEWQLPIQFKFFELLKKQQLPQKSHYRFAATKKITKKKPDQNIAGRLRPFKNCNNWRKKTQIDHQSLNRTLEFLNENRTVNFVTHTVYKKKP